jgi:predicted Ser/Thr protein kinase
MISSSDPLASLMEAHLAGRMVEVPSELRAEFDQAVAAHAALRGMLAETQCSSASQSQRQPPRVSDQYEIERELGHGGMGVVYLARQRSLNRRVALKVLRPGEQSFGPVMQRFLDEAQHLARLRHPNIVTIHEVGDADGEPFFTMDFIDGETLSAVIARGPLTPTRAVEVLKQIAAAVQHAHRQGIVHRDLKPGNVLIDQAGQVFVTDFGLARNLSQDSGMTRSGELLGTPQYMSPEQARGQTSMIGEATDIHAMGLLLFEMLSGRAAFGASSPADVLVRLLNEDPPPLRTIDRRIPRDLETICMKALHKSPAARYANVSALLEDLRRFEAGEPLLARRTSMVIRMGRWCMRRWKVAATVLVTVAVMAAIAPRLFDKSVDELIVWGDEELREGRPEIAVEIFQRALSQCNDAQKAQILPSLVEAIRGMDDSKLAVTAALKVIATDPETSFGRHDYLVAQAVALNARAATQNGYFEVSHGTLSPQELAGRELAAKRFSVFLDGGWGTREEREEAERMLQLIAGTLRTVRPVASWSPDELVKLPEGTIQELKQRASDLSLSPWDRGRALIAVARLKEAADSPAEAMTHYQRALEEIRRVYPFVSGVISGMQIDVAGDDNRHADSPECRLVRDLLDSIHRLDPEFRNEVTGGIRFRLDHPERLNGGRLSVRLRLCDEEISFPHQGLPRILSTAVPMNDDEWREVKVVPGRYRLGLEGTAFTWNSAEANPSRLDITVPDWPRTIEITDEMIELPPISVRRLAEIQLTRPAENSKVNLLTDSIEWTPVPDAVRYELTCRYFTDLPNPTVNSFHTISTDRTSFVPANLSGRDRDAILREWTTGRTAGVHIEAYNAQDQRIATTSKERLFLVVAGPEN